MIQLLIVIAGLITITMIYYIVIYSNEQSLIKKYGQMKIFATSIVVMAVYSVFGIVYMLKGRDECKFDVIQNNPVIDRKTERYYGCHSYSYQGTYYKCIGNNCEE